MRRELLSIVHWGQPNPASAWIVGFNGSNTDIGYKDYDVVFVRVVRSGP